MKKYIIVFGLVWLFLQVFCLLAFSSLEKQDVSTLDSMQLVTEIDKGHYKNKDLMNEMYRRYLFQHQRTRHLSSLYQNCFFGKIECEKSYKECREKK